MSDPTATRTLPINKAEGWILYECFQPTFAGYGGRSESARPWNAESLFRKLAYALPRFGGPVPVETVELDCTEGELMSLLENVPPTAAPGARDFLVRVMLVLASFAYAMPLLEGEPEVADVQARLAQWKEQPH